MASAFSDTPSSLASFARCSGRIASAKPRGSTAVALIRPSASGAKVAPRGARASRWASGQSRKVWSDEPVTIEIARTSIEYDDELSGSAGFLKISPGTPPIVPPNGDTLLHLLFFLIYTFVFNWVFDAIFGLPASAATAAQPA